MKATVLTCCAKVMMHFESNIEMRDESQLIAGNYGGAFRLGYIHPHTQNKG